MQKSFKNEEKLFSHSLSLSLSCFHELIYPVIKKVLSRFTNDYNNKEKMFDHYEPTKLSSMRLKKQKIIFFKFYILFVCLFCYNINVATKIRNLSTITVDLDNIGHIVGAVLCTIDDYETVTFSGIITVIIICNLI